MRVQFFLSLAQSRQFGLYWQSTFQKGLTQAAADGSLRWQLEEDLAAAAFYDLEGTLVSTNLVHTLGFYARNEPGLLRSLKKSASTLLSLPMFAVTDQYSRKVFNDL